MGVAECCVAEPSVRGKRGVRIKNQKLTPEETKKSEELGGFLSGKKKKSSRTPRVDLSVGLMREALESPE